MDEKKQQLKGEVEKKPIADEEFMNWICPNL